MRRSPTGSSPIATSYARAEPQERPPKKAKQPPTSSLRTSIGEDRVLGDDSDISEESEPDIAVEPNATRDSTPDTDAEDDAEVNDELEADEDEEDGGGKGDEDEEEEGEGEDDIEVDVEGDEEVDEMQESDDDAEDDEEEEEEETKPRAGTSRATRLRTAGGKFASGRTSGKASKSAKQQHLKIKLKLPAAPSTANTSAAATPEPVPLPKGKRSRQARALNIESEEDEEEEEEEEETPEYSRGTSVAGPSTRPMTTRQAVLASVVDSSHVSLDEGIRRKKVLNETELALRREETARKRKNLSEKKLENEKAETINRLLKKQSRSKARRGGPSGGLTAAPSNTDTPNLAGSRTPNEDEEAAAGDPGAADEGIEDDVEKVAPPPPVMYRWVSSVRNVGDGGEGEKSMDISFSVPVCALPEWMEGPQIDKGGDVDISAEVSNTRIRPTKDTQSKAAPLPSLPSAQKPQCAVPNCGLVRKYRLVKDFNVGACGMVHLKLLEGMSSSPSMKMTS